MGGAWTVSAMIIFREALEASILLGILWGISKRMGAGARRLIVLPAVLAASVGAVLLVSVSYAIAHAGDSEATEAVLNIVAGVSVLGVVYWARRHGPGMAADLRRRALGMGGLGLAATSFIVVLREAGETVLVLAPLGSDSLGEVLLGGLAGLAGAVVVGWLVVAAGSRISVAGFLKVSSLILVLVAGGLIGEGVHGIMEEASGLGLLEALSTYLYSMGEGEGPAGLLLELASVFGVPDELCLARGIVQLLAVLAGLRVAGLLGR